MKSLAINLGLFKLGWVAVVLSAAAQQPQVGVAAVAIVVLIHLVRAERVTSEFGLLLAVAFIGLAWESLLVRAGLVTYPTQTAAIMAPLWIVAMWVLFATTLNTGMRWLQKNAALAAIAGAIGGPMSFLAGQKAGAVTINDGGIIALAIGWGILLPLVAIIASRLDSPVRREPVPVETNS